MTYEQRKRLEAEKKEERAAAEAKAKKGESPATSDEAVKLLKEELEKLRQENKDLRADLKPAKKDKEAEAKKTTTAVAPETATAAQVRQVSQKVDQLSEALDAFLSKQKAKAPNPTITTFRKMPAWPDERFPGGYRPLTIKEAEVYNKAFPGKVKSLVAAVKIDAYDTEPEFVRWAKDEEAVIAILNMH